MDNRIIPAEKYIALSKCNKAQLLTLATRHKIPYRSIMSKAHLAAVLKEVYNNG